MTCQSHITFRSVVGNDAEPLLFSLYKESVNAWGDCVPLLYPSFYSVSDLLKKLLHSARKGNSSGSGERMGLAYDSLGSITRVPSHYSEVDVHCLKVFCRRLQVWDMLDLFVLRPVPFIDQKEEHIAQRLSLAGSVDFPLASSIIRLIGASLDDLEGGSDEVQRLYLAMTHLFHERILLMDGLHSTTKTGADDSVANTSRHKNSPIGDYLRVNTSPSSLLEFDGTKCADSIAILSSSVPAGNGSSVHQRSVKNWGTGEHRNFVDFCRRFSSPLLTCATCTVLSTRYFAPKTGIHRWAVRLDKCERGHVFIGVATSNCSLKTYVGGDKHGYGMIGTQALWTNRSKVSKICI